LSFDRRKEKSNWNTTRLKGGCGPAGPLGLEGEVGRIGPKMGRDSRVGCARWKMNRARKMKRKSGVADGLQGNTGRIEMGRERKNIIVLEIS
jgi:hypothetical protein